MRCQTSNPAPDSGLTINELILAYMQFADRYYMKDGHPTVEPGNIRLAWIPTQPNLLT